METNEATPAARGVTMITDDANEDELMGEAHVTSHVTSQGHVTSQSDRDNDDVQIIEIASDSEGNYLLIVLPSLLVYCSILSRIENRMAGVPGN